MARRNLAVKLISFVITAPIMIVVVLFAVSNRHLVPMELWPLPGALEVPLYLVALLALVAGFVLGGTIAWAGELGQKRRAVRAEKRAEDLEREIAVMRIREEEIRAQALPAPNRPALVDRRVA
ncbi:MAG: DUF1049 domain-containing protein [Alphaproteobacteria bacterium]|nr:DUF1049 domain-containing protein [Alphaproteobacteria bacterium]